MGTGSVSTAYNTYVHRVVAVVALGQSNKRIAGELGIAISTVTTLLTRAPAKVAMAEPRTPRHTR